VDGEQLLTAVDLYKSTGAHLVHTRAVWPQNSSGTNRLGMNYGTHAVRLSVDTATNASAVAVTATNHRLSIQSILAIDAR
jgi:hypothetical protein